MGGDGVRTWAFRVALVGALTLVVAACSGGGRSSSATTAASTTTATASPARSDGLLLAADELGAGWTVAPGSAGSSDAFGCDSIAAHARNELRTFRLGAAPLPVFGEMAESFPTNSAPHAFFVDNFVTHMCTSMTSVQVVSGSAAPPTTLGGASGAADGSSWETILTLPTASDESLAFRALLRGTVGLNRVVMRRDRTVLLTFLEEPGDPDAHRQLFSELTERAAAKIRVVDGAEPAYRTATARCRGVAASGAPLVYAGTTTLGAAMESETLQLVHAPFLTLDSLAASLAVCTYRTSAPELRQVYVDDKGIRFDAAT